MAGELWRQTWALGKETTYGTSVPATRQLYGTGNPDRKRAAHIIEVNTGTPDNVRGIKNRAVEAGGTFDQPLDADEIVELFLSSIQGGVTPTTSLGASTWVFKPGTTLDSQTWQRYDGYRGWIGAGVYVDTIKLTWNATAKGDNMVSATMFAQDWTTGTVTPGLTQRTPIWIEGWETNLFIDALGATPGTTAVLQTGISGTITLTRNLGRKYWAGNTQATGAVVQGKFGLTFDMVVEGNASGLTEYTDWDTSVARLIRLQFGNNGAVLGTSTLKRNIALDIPCFYTATDLTPEDSGTKAYKFTGNYSYDATNAFSFQATVVNSRSAAYT